MKFSCVKCGCQIIAEDISAGHKGKCPTCKEIVTIPSFPPPENIELDHEQNDTFPDLELKPLPEDDESPVYDYTAQDAANRSQNAHIEETEQIGQTGHSAFVEILTYPVVSSGVLIILIFVGFPAIVDLISYLMDIAPGLLTLILIPFLLAAMLVSFTASIYMFWYFSFCIQQSALGSAKMPDSLIEDNGFWDMFTTTLRVLACTALFLGPAAVYYAYERKFDVSFWAILSAGIFILPMVFLTTTIFGSLAGLNPYHIIRAIILTFKSYLLLVLSFLLFIALVVIPMIWIQLSTPAPFGLIARGIYVYFLFIMGHLAGRLYYKNAEKLKWEI